MSLKNLFGKLASKFAGKADNIADVAKYADDFAHIARTPDGWSFPIDDFEDLVGLPDDLDELSRRYAAVADNYAARIYKANDYIPNSMSKSAYKLENLGKRLLQRADAYLGGSDDIKRAMDRLDFALYDNDMKGTYLDIYRDVM